MASFIPFGDFTGDASTLAAQALDYLVANLSGWLPVEGNLEVLLIEALSQMVAESASVATKVPTAIFRYFGRTLVGVTPIDASKASTQSTWTMIDDAGYTIDAGTLVAFRRAGDVLVPFRVVSAVTVPPGSTSTASGEVIIEADVAGAASNSIPTGALELIDSLRFVASVASTAPTSGGADAETDDAYLDRLASELALLSPEPILPNDFSVLARTIPGVHRALTLDGYDPGTATSGNERMVTVVSVDVDGNAVPTSVKDNVQDLLDGMREVTFVVNVMDPTYTSIDVSFTATALPSYVAAEVQAAAIAAITSYLSPGTWSSAGDNINSNPLVPTWVFENKIRYLEVATILNLVPGLDHVTALTIMGASADYTMSGAAPLPRPGTITGTVT